MRKLIVLLVIAMFLFGCAKQQVKKDEVTIAPKSAKISVSEYVVKKGDTLWDIAENKYSDPFQWPLVYKANRDEIEDPDLIYVNQQFEIKKDFSKNEIDRAIRQAEDTPTYVPKRK